MGAAQHGHIGQIVRQIAYGMNHCVQFRQQYAVAPFAQHQGVRQIVDVFGRAGKVNELGNSFELMIAGDLFLEKVFDCLDVVIGGALDVFDPLGIFQGKLSDDLFQNVIAVFTERGHLRYLRMRGQ